MGKRYTETDRRDSFQDNAAERGVRDDVKRRRRHKTSLWLLFGVGILILLLLVWLTIAEFWGDTDVAADFIHLL